MDLKKRCYFVEWCLHCKCFGNSMYHFNCFTSSIYRCILYVWEYVSRFASFSYSCIYIHAIDSIRLTIKTPHHNTCQCYLILCWNNCNYDFVRVFNTKPIFTNFTVHVSVSCSKHQAFESIASVIYIHAKTYFFFSFTMSPLCLN